MGLTEPKVATDSIEQYGVEFQQRLEIRLESER